MLHSALRGALAGLLLSAAPVGASCPGDCDDNAVVTINELISGVSIALGDAPTSQCAAIDGNGDRLVTIDELIAAVTSTLGSCPPRTPTPKPIPALRFSGPHYLGLRLSGPTAVDVNGDEMEDIVGLWDGLEVYLNRGDGTLALADSIPLPDARRLIAAELNGDGIADLAIIHRDTVELPPMGTLSLLIGRGDGTFELARGLAGPGGARGLAAGDTNGDGITDLIVHDASDLFRFAGLGDGRFGPAEALERPEGSFGEIAMADFNGDQRADLVTGSPGITVRWLAIRFGRDDGHFEPEVSLDPPDGKPFVGDVDRDGSVDLLVATERGFTLEVLMGRGDGSFAPARSFPSGFPVDVKLADVDGNGALDVVSTDFLGGGLTVLVGDGAGGFRFGASLISDADSSVWSGVALADLDQDGASEIVAADTFNGLAIFRREP